MKKQGFFKALCLVSCILGILLLYTPILTLITYSFFSDGAHGFGQRLNFGAYLDLVHDKELLTALVTSIKIGVFSASLSLILGAYAAISLQRLSGKIPFSAGRPVQNTISKAVSLLISFLTLLPLLLPEIVFGLGLLVWFVLLKISLGSLSLVLAHVTFSVSYVFLTVTARMKLVDLAVEDAARDLGAAPFQILTTIYLPMLAPSLMAGWVMAFALSFDDFLISFFTAGPDTVTLPLALYSSIKFGVSPSVFAVSTLVFVISFLSASAITRLMSRSRKANGIA